MRRNILQISLLSVLVLAIYLAWPGAREMPEYHPLDPEPPPFLLADSAWADSVMATMNLDDRIAQMMMIQGYSNMGEAHTRDILRDVHRHRVGGIAFFQGDPLTQAMLTNAYQEAARTPLLIAMDGENGLGMRLKNTIRYPQTMALGAITDDGLLFRLGRDMGRQMKRLGVHLNFAPVADVNNNPANPVINTRSFGEDPVDVGRKVTALMKGMQSEGLLVAAKHFPGHGDTDADSHKALPTVLHARERLDSVELWPFREAVNRGLTAIMVAHLQVPALDPRENRPATVSEVLVRDLLQGEMGFRGLVITDALNMKGLSAHFEPGQSEVEAIKAGNDILLMPSDVGLAIAEIRRAVRRGEISEERIDRSCRKILMAKYWVGLAAGGQVDTVGLSEDLHKEEYMVHYRELVEQSLTLVRNRDSLLPLRNLEKIRLATVTLSRTGEQQFGSFTDLYLRGDHYTLRKDAGSAGRSALLRELESYNTIIVNVLNTSSYASRNYGITPECAAFISALPENSRLILNVAGIPYALDRLNRVDHLDAIVLSYSDEADFQAFTQQAIFGGRAFRGKLPVSWAGHAAAGGGISTPAPDRLGYASPMDVGLHPDTLARMEEIIREAIAYRAMPGCQVLVARRGKVVWRKSYGHHGYQGKVPVDNEDIYDLASITKIAATLPALMKLREEGRFHEDSCLGAYLEFSEGCDKAGLKVGDILSHQAGLMAWIPFYQETLEPLDSARDLVRHHWSPVYALKIGPFDYANRDVKYVDSIYDRSYSLEYPVQVADQLYMRASQRDTLYKRIDQSELLSREYRYSDLGYYYFQRFIESATDTTLYPLVWYNFYAPMGAETLGYLPLNRFDAKQIVPTENDLFFRRQLLRGHVHDMGAAMLGGVAGHAGLFGNAHDLAKMMQMYLNGGSYGQRRFLQAATLERFTSCYDCEHENRRGLGFDRPIDLPGEGPACDSASMVSYGHSGFTGCLAWVDPQYELVFIFLSNRIHPGAGNDLLITGNIRTRVQQVVYDAIMD